MYRCLRDFINALDSAGELVRISTPVSPLLEISALTDYVSRNLPAPSVGLTGRESDPDHAAAGGPALLFENIEGCMPGVPVAINLFGSYRRMEMALGCHDDGPTPGGFNAIADDIASLLRPVPPRGLREILAKAAETLPLLKTLPKIVKSGPCQQHVLTGDQIDLTRWPIIKCWPLDGNLAAVGYPAPEDHPDTSAGQGRFITFAGMHTIHAEDAEGKAPPASYNIGMYRAQLIDRNHLAMHWHVHHDGAAHWRSWKRAGRPMPIAIVLGGESVLPYAATCPLPPGISELLMAGFLNHGPIRLIRCRTVPIDVPVNAEIVIEGWVSTQAGFPGFDPRDLHEASPRLGPGAVFEGPFGDHTGFYSLPDRYPIVEVTAITHRRNPIYPTTIVGPPPQEDYYLGKATERIMLPLLKTIAADIVDYDLPLFGCFHNCAVIQIDKAYPFHARRMMHAVWGAGQMSWTKVVIIIDRDVNIHRRDDVWRAVFSNTHFRRDLEFVRGPLDILDHAAPSLGAGSKLGIDATRKIAGEDAVGLSWAAPLPVSTAPDEVLQKILRDRPHVRDVAFPAFGCNRCAFIAYADDAGDDLSRRAVLQNIVDDRTLNLSMVIAVRAHQADINDPDAMFFHWVANCDPGRDAVRGSAGIAFDAAAKGPRDSVINNDLIRDFPPILEFDAETRGLLKSKWTTYGFKSLGV